MKNVPIVFNFGICQKKNETLEETDVARSM